MRPATTIINQRRHSGSTTPAHTGEEQKGTIEAPQISCRILSGERTRFMPTQSRSTFVYRVVGRRPSDDWNRIR